MNFIESENVELKSIYVDDIKKEIVAFANTRGGTIYIGVEDDGTVCGVQNTDAIILQVGNAARDAIKPDVTMFMQVNVLTIEGKPVIEVQVQCGAHRPYYLAGKGLRPEGVFVRQSTSAVPASDTAIRQMIKETDGDNYEDMRSLNQELTFDKVSYEFSRRNLEFKEPQMRTLGLVDSEGLYSNLALLLSDQCPHIIKAATFAGVDQECFRDRREFTGSLLKQLEDSYEYLSLRNQNQATFEGLLRIDHKDYPNVAIRESLLNAIVHRDYAVSASTLLSVYRNRIELISIGGLAGGISYEDMMLGVSYCRNKKLADVFYRLQLIESYGTGMQKIMSSYKKNDEKPTVQVTSGAFKFSLPNRNDTMFIDAVAAPDKKEQAVLDLFKGQEYITRSDIEKMLGVSTSTAYRIIQKLISCGKLKSSGGTRNAKYSLAE